MFRQLALIAIGGAFGSVVRFALSALIHKNWSSSFPLGTFAVNALGCFAIGLFMSYLQKQELEQSAYTWLLVTGFCGGFTTFSAFAYENLRLFQNGQAGVALLYSGASVMIGIIAAWAGFSLSQ